MNVNVGQSIANHVVKEAQIQEATFLPIDFCIREDEVQHGHENDVSSQKYQNREVHSGTKGIGKQNQNEQAAQDLKEHRQKQNSSIKQGRQVFVQSSSFQCGMVRRKAPSQAQNGCHNGNGLVSLDNREIEAIIFAHGKESKGEGLSGHGSYQHRENNVKLNGGLKTRLQTDFHHSCRAP